jgi:Tol biopolymer transport system component
MRSVAATVLLATFAVSRAFAQVPPRDVPRPNAAIPDAGQIPVKFAAGRISTPELGCPTFTPDEKTVYFARHTPPPSTLMVSHFRHGEWTLPKPLPFSGSNSRRVYDGDPALSPDGSQLFFASQESKGERAQIWSVRRQGDGWSDPARTADGLCGPSVASDGTLYFCSDGPESRGKTDIYRSRLIHGVYGPPENLGDAINTIDTEYDAYIAPDQSYLIFVSGRPGGNGRNDLYISFQRDGQWTQARNLGLTNAPSVKVCPVVSPDGKHFLFTTADPGKGGIYQVETSSLNLHR